MASKIYNRNKTLFIKLIAFPLGILFLLAIIGYAPEVPAKAKNPVKSPMKLIERHYSYDSSKISIGIANIQNKVSAKGTASIEENKQRILNNIDELKKHHVNMILFPEFCLTGYFWDESPACWKYMKQGVTNNQLKWLSEIKSKLDDDLQYIIFNNIRLDPKKPDGKFLNSIYVVDKDFDSRNLNSGSNEKFRIYDKTFLPGIEKVFTRSGKKDVLVVDTKWGKFGFTTCYDMCFPQIYQEYAMFDKVDAVVELASWRGTSEREYPKMNVRSDHYYGYIWDLMASSQAVFNQIWIIACNAVGTQERGNYEFWGGSGIWAPSGIELFQGSHNTEELIVIHNIDIKGQVEFEHNDFSYYQDFIKIYDPIKNGRKFTRMKGE